MSAAPRAHAQSVAPRSANPPPPTHTHTQLTREVLEVLGSDSTGAPSEMFDYFTVGGRGRGLL